jgi:hypothetical protein
MAGSVMTLSCRDVLRRGHYGLGTEVERAYRGLESVPDCIFSFDIGQGEDTDGSRRITPVKHGPIVTVSPNSTGLRGVISAPARRCPSIL